MKNMENIFLKFEDILQNSVKIMKQFQEIYLDNCYENLEIFQKKK